MRSILRLVCGGERLAAPMNFVEFVQVARQCGSPTDADCAAHSNCGRQDQPTGLKISGLPQPGDMIQLVSVKLSFRTANSWGSWMEA